MSTRTFASISILLVSAGLLPALPAKAEMQLDSGLCNQVYQQEANASASQSLKSQNISGGVSYAGASANVSSQYKRSNAASESDLQSYYEMNCDSYIQAAHGEKLADIQSRERQKLAEIEARERENANNNQTELQVVQDINGATVQTNQEDNVTRRINSKNNLIGTGLGVFSEIAVALINRPRNSAPVVQTVVSTQNTYQPASATPIPPHTQPPAESVPSPQVAYAPQMASTFPAVMLTNNPNEPVSPVVIAKVNAALASQGLASAACNVNSIVVLNIANGQYTACAYPSATYSPGNYRLNIPGF